MNIRIESFNKLIDKWNLIKFKGLEIQVDTENFKDYYISLIDILDIKIKKKQIL